MSGHPHYPTFGPSAPTRLQLKGIRCFAPAHDDGAGGGESFTAITTQEEFDARIQQRIARAQQPYEALKGLDVADVVAKYNAAKDVDIPDLQAKAQQLATVLASQGASEQQLTQRITDAEARATAAEQKATTDAQTIDALNLQLARYEAAADADIPLSHAPRLIGSTKEELIEDAKSFKSTLRTGGYVPGQGQGGGGAQEGAAGIAEAEKRFGKPSTNQ